MSICLNPDHLDSDNADKAKYLISVDFENIKKLRLLY